MHVFIFSGKRLLIGASICIAALLAAAGTGFVLSGKTSTANTKPKQLPIYCVKTEEKKIGLTFDAAWGNSDTDRLISILKKHQAKATFFTTGEWVDKFPEDVKKLVAAGHDIQNHSDKHPHVTKIKPNDVLRDAKACDDKIEKLTGTRPTLYRAPYGEYNNDMMAAFASAGSHQIIQWNVETLDI